MLQQSKITTSSAIQCLNRSSSSLTDAKKGRASRRRVSKNIARHSKALEVCAVVLWGVSIPATMWVGAWLGF